MPAAVAGDKPKENPFSVASIKKGMDDSFDKVQELYEKAPGTEGTRPPRQVAQVINYILKKLIPNQYSAGTNDIRGGDVQQAKKDWLNDHFKSSGGMTCFTIPKQDARYEQDADYSVVEGVKIYVAKQELMYDGMKLKCRTPGCRCKGEGDLIHYRYPFYHNHGIAIPVLSLDVEHPVSWIVPHQ